MGGDVERQSLAQLDLREKHVECVTGFHAELLENLSGLPEAIGGNAGAKKRGVCGHAQICS